jgi:hypothetical protein
MDDIVKAALKKWPNVPHAFDWLGLDARGDWYLRDERAQAAGPFPAVKGSRIEHEQLKAFIGRNYEPDEQGRWHFQNGPQRVYVELEAAPWVWRVEWRGDSAALSSHTGRQATLANAWIDEQGRLFAETDIGFGIVHTQDVVEASRAVEQGLWQPRELPFAEAPQRFGFVLHPRP